MASRLRRLTIAAGTAGVFVLGSAGALGAQAGAGQPGEVEQVQPDAQRIDERAKSALRRTAKMYRRVDTLRGEANMKMSVGETFESRSEVEIAAERPNKVMLRYAQDGKLEHALVSDGRTLHQYFGGPLNIYSETPAPESFKAIMTEGSMGFEEGMDATAMFMTPHLLTLRLLEGGWEDELLDGSRRVVHVGREDLDGEAHDRVRLEGDQFNVDLWIRAGDEAWISRIVPDMSPMFEEMKEQFEGGEEGPGILDQVPQITITFGNWNAAEGPPAEAFAFEAPEGAEKVESIAEAMRERFEGEMEDDFEMEHAELVGKPAPALDLELLEGGRATLEDHEGKVVVLDFWATWCPPCVRGLPILASVAEKYKDKDVVIYAVNVQEQAEAVRKFLERRELDLNVPMDRNGEASGRYGVSGIPQTVLIGKDGTVQAVHVGLAPDMEERLSREIDTLLEGKSLVDAEAVGRGGGDAGAAGDAPELEEVWSARGSFQGVAVDQDAGHVLAVSSRGRATRVRVLDAEGDDAGEVRLNTRAQEAGYVRLAKLKEDGPPAIVVFQRWGQGVRAFDREGELLWEYVVGQGVNDVVAADLTGDGLDEIIIGYNGMTGLHALKADGEVLWMYREIGNVWHVAAGDLGGDDRPQPITTSATGQVHIFDQEGRKVRDAAPGVYANLVRLAHAEDGSPVIIVGASEAGGTVVGLSSEGKRLWRTRLAGAGRAHLVDAAGAPGHPWVALADASGSVTVLDVGSGDVLGAVSTGDSPTVAWIAVGGEAPRLVVSSSRGVRAYKVPPAGEAAVEEARE